MNLVITYDVSITDIVQAAGAGIAIVAAIFGFITFFSQMRQRKEEIKSLSDQVSSQLSISQSQIGQLKLVGDQNELLTKQLALLQEAISQDKDIHLEMVELEREKERNKIRPVIHCSTGRPAADSKKGYIVHMENVGEAAIIKKVVQPEGGFNSRVVAFNFIGTRINHGEKLDLTFIHDQPMGFFNISAKARIVYIDIEENYYYTDIRFYGGTISTSKSHYLQPDDPIVKEIKSTETEIGL